MTQYTNARVYLLILDRIAEIHFLLIVEILICILVRAMAQQLKEWTCDQWPTVIV